MSKPLTMAPQSESHDRATIRTRLERKGAAGTVTVLVAKRAWTEVDALRASLAAAEAKLETIEATATANARDYWQAKLADERKRADAIIKAADELCSRGLWPDTLLRYETAKAARRAARDGHEGTR